MTRTSKTQGLVLTPSSKKPEFSATLRSALQSVAVPLFQAVTIAKLGPGVLDRPLCAPRLEYRTMSRLNQTGADSGIALVSQAFKHLV